MVELDFGGVKENVITREEFTVEKAKKILKNEVVVSLGYGIQGRAQSLNMRDNGVKVIVGQEKEGFHKPYYELAVKEGWVPGETLFSMEEASRKEQSKCFSSPTQDKEKCGQSSKKPSKKETPCTSHTASPSCMETKPA